eukprot:GHVS01031605.1.p1 GENE.GHVS01031605.1~~GHVS01031605.1.p1  ORF type:complete len:1507 (-),score=211.25 GHVS01031605.1:84-4217(-)
MASSSAGSIRRSLLGVCPQHNVLWEQLTVYEHVQLFADLKQSADPEEVKSFVEDVGLLPQLHRQVKQLSGGMKRKLSVAMAFVGRPKFVILDEPSSGLDPHSRHELWGLLRRWRQQRCIVVSTHYMEEAEMLGDSVAIMARGGLKCCGSVFFLKHRYGCFYTLSAVKQSPGSSLAGLLATLRTLAPGIRMTSNTKTEMQFKIPLQNKSDLRLLVEHIDCHRISLGVSSYGLSITTLEDVFLSIACDEDEDEVAAYEPDRRSPTRGEGGGGRIWGGEDGCEMHVLADRSELKGGEGREGNGEATEEGLGGDGSTIVGGAGGGCSSSSTSDHVNGCATAGNTTYNSSAAHGGGALLLKRDSTSDDVSAVEDGSLAGTWLSPSNSPSADRLSSPPSCRSASLLWRQIAAILVKRVQYSRRDIRTVICQFFLPTFVVLGGLSIVTGLTHLFDMPPLVLSPEIALAGNVDGVDRTLAFTYTEGLGPYARRYLSGGVSRGYWSAAQELPCNHTLPQLKENEVFNDFELDRFFKRLESGEESLEETQWRNFSINMLNSPPPSSRLGGYSFAHSSEGIDDRVDGPMISRSSRLAVERYVFHRLTNRTVPYVEELDPNTGNVTQQQLIDLERLHVGVFYNTTALHSRPVHISALPNLVLQELGVQRRVEIVNHPLPAASVVSHADLVQDLDGFTAATLSILAFTFIPAGLIYFIVKEKQSKLKFIQFIAGVDPLTFWLSNFIFDIMFYTLPVAGVLSALFYFDIRTLISHKVLGPYLAAVFAFGIASCSQCYFLSHYFSDPATSQVLTLGLNSVVGITLAVASYILTVLTQVEHLQLLRTITDRVTWLSRVLPAFCFGHTIFLLPFCSDSPHSRVVFQCTSPWDWDVIGYDLIMQAVNTLVYFSLTVLLDSPRTRSQLARYADRLRAIRWWLPQQVPSIAEDEVGWSGEGGDAMKEGVRTEEKRVQEMPLELKLRQSLCVDSLTKQFRRCPTAGQSAAAVDSVSFAAQGGEILAILGPNGAGKTTLLKMLCGEVEPTRGHISVAGHSMTDDPMTCSRQMGYCPQFDALWELLTPREHLRFFARIRGYPQSEVEALVQRKLAVVQLLDHADMRAGCLSGGMMRKLSLAIATVTSPPLLLLDEPSCGLDPGARRFIRKVVKSMACEYGNNSLVIITTHAMDEAEALASRLIVMARGKVRAIGSTQAVKEAYGSGMQLEVKFRRRTGEEAARCCAERWQIASNDQLTTREVRDICVIYDASLGATDEVSMSRLTAAVGYIHSSVARILQREEVVTAEVFAEWWLIQEDVDKLFGFVKARCPGVTLLEGQDVLWKFRIPHSESVSVGNIFSFLEGDELRELVGSNMEEFTLTQPTLQQVFHTLISHQVQD